MRLFQCPKCGTPISRIEDGECSCGTRIPTYIVQQILAMRQLPAGQLDLQLEPSTGQLPLYHDPTPHVPISSMKAETVH